MGLFGTNKNKAGLFGTKKNILKDCCPPATDGCCEPCGCRYELRLFIPSTGEILPFGPIADIPNTTYDIVVQMRNLSNCSYDFSGSTFLIAGIGATPPAIIYEADFIPVGDWTNLAIIRYTESTSPESYNFNVTFECGSPETVELIGFNMQKPVPPVANEYTLNVYLQEVTEESPGVYVVLSDYGLIHTRVVSENGPIAEPLTSTINDMLGGVIPFGSPLALQFTVTPTNNSLNFKVPTYNLHANQTPIIGERLPATLSAPIEALVGVETTLSWDLLDTTFGVTTETVTVDLVAPDDDGTNRITVDISYETQ